MGKDYVAILLVLFFSAIMTDSVFGAIDINESGELERLQTERPEHYRAITEIVWIAERASCRSAEFKLIKTKFDLSGMSCQLLIKTSYPPKRHLDFVYRDTRYSFDVTLKYVVGKPVPVQ